MLTSTHQITFFSKAVIKASSFRKLACWAWALKTESQETMSYFKHTTSWSWKVQTVAPPVFNSPTGKLTKYTLTKHWAPAYLCGSHYSHWQRLNLNLPPERTTMVLRSRVTDVMFWGRQSGIGLWMKRGRDGWLAEQFIYENLQTALRC